MQNGFRPNAKLILYDKKAYIANPANATKLAEHSINYDDGTEQFDLIPFTSDIKFTIQIPGDTTIPGPWAEIGCIVAEETGHGEISKGPPTK